MYRALKDAQSEINFCTVNSAVESWASLNKSIDLRSYIGLDATLVTFGKRLLHKVGFI